jgi:outer membrane protein assembly factor BamB
MRRRFFLKGTAACLGGAVASTLGVDDRIADAQETGPTVVDTEFTVRDSSCGTGSQRATVRADTAANSVTVDGVIAAPSACYTAELADATYDEAVDALALSVRTVEREDAGICAQCITDVEYRAVVTVDGGQPAQAVVRHDDEAVTETALDAGPANWRQSAFDAANTAVDAGGRGPGRTPAVQWSRDGVGTAPAVVSVDAGGGDGEAPEGASEDGTAVSNGVSSGGSATAFVGASGGGITALNAETGNERWSFDGVGPVAGTPAVVGGTVYAGSTDGQIAAVDASTGDPAWSRSVDGVLTAGPTVGVGGEANADGSSGATAVYVATRDSDGSGRVHAVDPPDGAVQWTVDAGGSVSDSPAAADERVYVARSDGTLLALSSADGREQWELAVGDAAAYVSPPAVRDGTAYLAAMTENESGTGGRVFAVDAASGESEWTAELGASAVPRSFAVAEGTVVVGAAAYGDVALIDGNAAADGASDTGSGPSANSTDTNTTANTTNVNTTATTTDADTTANSTDADTTATVTGGVSADAETDGTSGTAGRIYALDAVSGEERWRRNATSAVAAGPTVAGETAYVPLDGGVAAVAVDGGTERWTASFPARVTAAVTPAVGRLYAPVKGDRLAALAGDGSGG